MEEKGPQDNNQYRTIKNPDGAEDHFVDGKLSSKIYPNGDIYFYNKDGGIIRRIDKDGAVRISLPTKPAEMNPDVTIPPPPKPAGEPSIRIPAAPAQTPQPEAPKSPESKPAQPPMSSNKPETKTSTRFFYRAIDPRDKRTTGTIEAATKEDAETKLREMDFYTIGVLGQEEAPTAIQKLDKHIAEARATIARNDARLVQITEDHIKLAEALQDELDSLFPLQFLKMIKLKRQISKLKEKDGQKQNEVLVNTPKNEQDREDEIRGLRDENNNEEKYIAEANKERKAIAEFEKNVPKDKEGFLQKHKSNIKVGITALGVATAGVAGYEIAKKTGDHQKDVPAKIATNTNSVENPAGYKLPPGASLTEEAKRVQAESDKKLAAAEAQVKSLKSQLVRALDAPKETPKTAAGETDEEFIARVRELRGAELNAALKSASETERYYDLQSKGKLK